MNITHLGTAAAERIPGLFCRCDLCRFAREQGGREIRTQSQAIIDGRLLIPATPICICSTAGSTYPASRRCWSRIGIPTISTARIWRIAWTVTRSTTPIP